MIVCDAQYMRELERRMKTARKALPVEVTDAIDREIEAIERQGDPWYSLTTIGLAFQVSANTLFNRIHWGRWGFQGDLPRLPLEGTKSDPCCGTWFDAASVNKDARGYRPWETPDQMVAALQISHRFGRYQNALKYKPGQISQNRIDKWRIENGNEKVLE